MRKIVFILILTLVFSCHDNSKEGFSLTGKTINIEDGTVLYFDNTEKVIDSVIVQNNSFKFLTKLPDSPVQVVLRTKDFSKYRFLWLENNSMTFDATNSDFRNAKVTGSSEENLSQLLAQETRSLSQKERREKEIEFIKNHPNSVNSAYILSVYSTTWGKKVTKELFDSFSEENKNNTYGKSIAKYIQLNKDIVVGGEYVDFEMADTNGEMRKLSELNGKLVLLEFWSSNCGPCRKENPNLVKTYEKFKPKGFEIFAVSQDTKKENWLNAIKDDKLPWLQTSDLLGRDNLASLIYGINGIPDNFLINQNGVIIDRNLRGERLNKKLDELLN